MHTETGAVTSDRVFVNLDDTTLRCQPESLRACRVLVVDDDPLTRAHLAFVLRRAGYDVRTAGSGIEALGVLRATSCQMMITDLEMPEMDGLVLSRTVREVSTDHHVYVLMLTVRAGQLDVLAGLAAGVDDYLVKGASAEEILAHLEVGRRMTHLEQPPGTGKRANRLSSLIDPLTGARSPHFLLEFLSRELRDCRRHRRPLAVLSCDIDNFKRVNDVFGHLAGDAVSAGFVARVLSCMRGGSDWVARLGGEEFLVVLPGATLSGATVVANKLQQLLRSQPVITDAGPLTVTTSIGIAAVETAEDLAAASIRKLLCASNIDLYAKRGISEMRPSATFADSPNEVTALAARGLSEVN
jgi:two-component system cell cycle response regulator